MTDKQELKSFERKMGIFDLAGATTSGGSVVVFTEGIRPGTIIADAKNNKQQGGSFQAFLENEIANGWGKMGVTEEMVDLERRVRAKINAEGATDEVEKMYGRIALGFAQFEGRAISYTGTGLDFPWIIREYGCVEEIRLTLPKFKKDMSPFHPRPIRDCFTLDGDDVFLLKSGGLTASIKHSFCTRAVAYAMEHGLALDATLYDTLPPELACGFGEDHPQSLIINMIRTYQTRSAQDIRDGIVSGLGGVFSLDHDHHTYQRDDITFAVIKRWA